MTTLLTRPWVLPGLISIVAFGFLLATGVSPASGLIAIAVIGLQGWAGAYAWSRLTRRRADVLELAGLGLAIGTAAAVISGLLVRTLGLGSWGWALPAAAALAALVLGRVVGRGRQTTMRPLARLSTGSALGLLAGAALGLLSLAVNLANYPLTWTGVWERYHPDMLFFEALSTSMARYGPLDSVFLSGGQVRYHWLVYAWSGQVAEASAADPFAVLTRVLPFTATTMVVLIAVSWAGRLSRVPWVPTLAVALVLLGGYVGATYGTILNFDSPSQAVSTAWLLAMCVVFLRLLRRPDRTAPLSAVLALLGFATAGGKISSGAVGVAAMGLVWLTGAFRRAEWQGRAFAGTAAAGAGLVTAYLLIVSGSADPGGLALGQLVDRASSVQGLNPLNSSLGIALGTAILAIAIAVRWSGLAWLAASPRSRWSPVSLLGTGLAVAGIATVLLVSGGLNDTWFALAASAPLSVISAAGAGRAAAAVGAASRSAWITRPLAWTVVAGLALSGVVAGVLADRGVGGQCMGVLAAVAGTTSCPCGVLLGGVVGRLISRHRSLRGSYRARWLAMYGPRARRRGCTRASPGMWQPPRSESSPRRASATRRSPRGSRSSTESTPCARPAWSSEEAAAGAGCHGTSAARDDIVLTNITFSPLVPALSGLRTWVSGTQYQAPYGRPGQLPTLVDREQQAWEFIDSPTESRRRPCARRVSDGSGWTPPGPPRAAGNRTRRRSGQLPMYQF